MFCGRSVWPASKYYCAGFCVWGRPFLSSIFIEMGLDFLFSKLIYFYYEKKMKRKKEYAKKDVVFFANEKEKFGKVLYFFYF